MAVEIVARARAGSITQLVCHPRLPYVVGVQADRPTVHIWDCGDGQLRELETIGADSAPYKEDSYSRDRLFRDPVLAWHPDEPLLAVRVGNGVLQWTPDGLGELRHAPSTAVYPYLSMAFSPDGKRLWASPSSSSSDEYTAWETSDVIDLAAGTVGTARSWDTGVAVHPAGGLVAALSSDQGGTLCLFARPDHAMRMLRHALILDADGYQTPIFSPDGRYLAIRGNAYENSLDVFELPSLHRVLATVLGDPHPGYPYPEEWSEQFDAWSRQNIAFGAALWIGTPGGTLVEVDIDNRQAIEHEVLDGASVTALASTATGELVVTTDAGELVIVATDSAAAGSPDAGRVRAFLDSTSEAPDEGTLDDHLVLIEGTRVWTPEERAEVTTATDTDPTWLQLTAAINTARDVGQ